MVKDNDSPKWYIWLNLFGFHAHFCPRVDGIRELQPYWHQIFSTWQVFPLLFKTCCVGGIPQDVSQWRQIKIFLKGRQHLSRYTFCRFFALSPVRDTSKVENHRILIVVVSLPAVNRFMSFIHVILVSIIGNVLPCELVLTTYTSWQDLKPVDEDAGLPELADADLLIWTGDLNYRIDLSYDDVINHIKKAQWDALLSRDQLRFEMANGRTFQGLREAAIRFSPTYKFDKWTSCELWIYSVYSKFNACCQT